MSHVFISYSRQDKAFVDRLVNDLRDNGIDVWRDVDSILPGSDWAAAIIGGIEQASSALMVFSQASRSSDWVNHETRYILGSRAQLRIIPIVLDDEGEKALPPDLRRLEWVDFRQDYDHQLARLVAALPADSRTETAEEPKTNLTKGYAFISYAEEDASFVDELRKHMEDRGYGYWDYRTSERTYQVALFQELEHGIREASAILCVISPDWKLSQWAPREYLYSLAVKTPTFLLQVRELEPTLLIIDRTFIDFVGDRNEGFGKLDRELDRHGL